MYTKRNYGFWMTLWWSKKPLILGILYSYAIYLLIYFTDFEIMIPWQPISVIGIAVAFYLGFKNNSSYDRTWEARKIWGAIVNDSRSYAAAVISFVRGPKQDEYRRELIYRHIAWMTALRYQLRLSREWEHTDLRVNGKFVATVCEDFFDELDSKLEKLISKEELKEMQGKTNYATQLLRKQAERMEDLKDEDYYDDFRHMELHQLMVRHYDNQGKSERIKNFPFPRQYASTALWLTIVFAALMPFGLLDIFDRVEQPLLYWSAPFINGLLIWVFFLMEKIGDYSENPFEGTYNDVPITSISIGIEIDLREMLNEPKELIPAPLQPENGFLL